MLQAVRVFVSSTFRDMHAERDHLNRFVFPRLRQLCEQRAVDFVAVDLRWGITLEEAEQHLAVDLCLGEIERCRPFFIGLLGDRYGWVPPPDHIDAGAFERVRARLATAEQALLDQYYRVDRNLERPAARLNWEAVDLDRTTPTLVRLLQQVAGPDTGKSITELEIERALALNDEGALEPCAYFYLREGAVHHDRQFPAEMVPVFCETDPTARERLQRLKSRLRNPATPGSVCAYEARYAGLRIDPVYLPRHLSPAERESLADGVVQPGEWQHLSAALRAALQSHGTIALHGLESWGERVVEDLFGAIETLLAQQPKRRSALDDTREAHERFIRERTRLFVGRAELVEQVLDFVGGRDDDAVLVLWGVAGSGKSTLLAQCVRCCREHDSDTLVLPHFIGAAPGTTRLAGTLTSLCLALKAHLDSDQSLASDPLELEGQLLSLLEQAGDRGPVLLFIDALNQLDPSNGSHELRWLPARLPRGVRLVVSTLPGTCLERLRNRVPSHRHLELPALARDEREELVTRVLAQRGKRLSEPHRRLLLDVEARPDASLPLYLVVALEELSLFGDFDGLERRIRALPEGLPALFDQVLERLELDHGRHATEQVLTRIAASRAGLLESEILDLLASSQLATTPLWWSRLRLALDFYLQRVDSERGTTDFFHEQLRTAVYRRYLTMESAQHAPSTAAQAVHRELADYFIDRARTGDTWQPKAARPLGELTYHLELGARLQALTEVLCEPAFLEAKLEAHPPASLIEDFDRLLRHRDAPSAALDPKGLSWLRDVIRLAAHVLRGDPSQLRSQLWARLLPRRSPMTDTLRAALIDTTTQPWLLAYATDLTPVGGTLRRTLAGMNCVNGVVISPDDEIALCHDDDNVLWLWNLRTGTVWRQIELDRRPWIFESTRHPDKPIAFVGKQGGGVFEVDMEAAALTRTLPTPRDLEALCVTPDGKYLLTAHKLGKVACLNLSDKAVSRELNVGWDDVAALVAIDAHRVLVGVGSRVEEWDLTKQRKIGTRHEHGSDVEVLALSADRRLLATGLADGSVELTNLSTGYPTRLRHATEAGERSAVKGLAFTPKGEQLLAAGPGNDLQVWDTTTGELRLTLRGHSMGVYAVATLADGQRAASVSKDGTLRIWDLAGEATPTPDFQHTAAIAALAVGPDFIVSGGRDRELCAWDLASGRLLRHWQAHEGETIQQGWVGALAVTADGKRIVSAGSDGSYRTWDYASGERIASRRGSWGTHDHYALSPDGALVASYRSSGQLNQLEMRRTSSGRRIRRVDLGHPVSAIAIAPNRHQIAVTDLDGGFDVVEAATGKLLWSHAVQGKDKRNYIESLCIGSSGRHAVLGFKHGQVALWDLEDRRLLGTHALHTDRVVAVAISPNERLACSASWDRALKVWRLPSAEPIATYSSDDFWSACAFADDAGVIVAGDEQGCVHFLRLREPKLAR